jgi:hypothetical protein
VVYEDGSARAVIDRPGRPGVNYGPGSPTGNRPTTTQPYEGRLSLPGRSALLYLVYGGETKVAPAEFELVNVRLKGSEAFLTADFDDGVNLTPILLRRVSRLVR